MRTINKKQSSQQEHLLFAGPARCCRHKSLTSTDPMQSEPNTTRNRGLVKEAKSVFQAKISALTHYTPLKQCQMHQRVFTSKGKLEDITLRRKKGDLAAPRGRSYQEGGNSNGGVIAHLAMAAQRHQSASFKGKAGNTSSRVRVRL